MFRINYFCIIVLSLHLFSCKNDAPKVPAESNVVSVKSPITELTQPEIPGVPQHVMERLLNQCTFIDYIFHDYTFSVSQAEDSDIDQNISFIDFNKPIGKMITGCKPMARKFFQINGKIEFDVDVYLSDKCSYYVFVDKKSKPIYANYMTDAGKQFYTNIIQQATGATPKK